MKKRRLFSLSMPKGYNKLIHAAVLFMAFFGVIMVVSANMGTNTSGPSLIFAGLKEFFFAASGYILMVWFARHFKLDFFIKHYLWFLTLMILSLLATLAFSPVGGAQAWLRFGPFTLQPAEFAKIFVILMLAAWLGDKQQKKIAGAWDLLGHPFVVILTILIIVVVLQNDLGSGVVILAVAYLAMLVPVHHRLSKLQKWMLGLFASGIFLIFFVSSEKGLSLVEKFIPSAYMLARFHTSANPFALRYGDGYQVFNSILAITRGGLWGRGLGNGFIKLGYLPEAQTDFILAVIMEELGFIGFLFVFIGYATLIYQLLRSALRLPKERDKVILVGAVAYLAIHYIFNVGGIAGAIPLTGVPLLLISAGGSSKWAIFILLGICQGIIASHNTKVEKHAASH